MSFSGSAVFCAANAIFETAGRGKTRQISPIFLA
jgi:hypothetical protein